MRAFRTMLVNRDHAPDVHATLESLHLEQSKFFASSLGFANRAWGYGVFTQDMLGSLFCVIAICAGV